MDLSQPILNVMTKDPICLDPAWSISQAGRLFESSHFRHLPVVESGKLIGILSKSDFNCYRRGLEMIGTRGQDQITGNLLVADMMTPDPVTLPAGATIKDAMAIFSKHEFHALPVVMGSRLVGIFTTRDLIRLFNFKSSAPGLEPHVQ